MMEELASRFVRFARELYRRRVPRVATAYLVAGWAVATFAGDVASFLELPVWAPKLILALLILGFPVTIAVSWAFDLTAQGVVRTPAEHDLAPRLVARPSYGKPIGAVVIGAVVLFLAVWNVWQPGQRGGGAEIPAGFVAVMPAETPGIADLDHVVTTLVATRLQGMGWRVVDPARVFREAEMSAIPDPRAQNARVAERVGAASFVEVRLLVGDEATLTASLYTVREPEAQIGHGEAVGSFDNLLPLVDQASMELSGLTIPVPQQRIAILPAAVTGSQQHGYLSEAVATLFSAKLEMVGWPTIDSRPLMGELRRISLAQATESASMQQLPSDGVQGIPEFDAGLAAEIVDDFAAGLFVTTHVEVSDGVRARRRSGSESPEVRFTASLFRVDAPYDTLLTRRRSGTLADLPELVDAAAHDLIEWAGIASAMLPDISHVPTSSLTALKAFTEGERAFRRGDIAEARESFRTAVGQDSAFAHAHYRLSVAAEWLSNNADLWKQRGIDEALKHSERLPWRQRLLLEARDIWKSEGNAEGTEQLYEWIIANWDDDYEAWFQLAELLTHDGPLQGRSAIEAGDHWQKLLVHDNLDFPVLMHFARVLALEGRQNELQNIAQQSLALDPVVDRALEVNALLAFARKDSAREAWVLQELAGTRPQSIWTAAARVGIYARNLEGAARIARLLIEPSRPDSVRVLGHVTLAYLLLGQGRWRDARAQLERVYESDPLTALVHTATLSAAPFVPELSRNEMEEIREQLERLPARMPTGVAATEFTVNDSIQDELRLYALGTISMALGRTQDAERIAAQLQGVRGIGDPKRIAQRFAQTLAAMLQMRSGATLAAAEKWENFRVEAGNDKIWLSPFFALSRERFVRASVLKEVGRVEEALVLFSSFGETSVYDLTYMAAAHFQRAGIFEALGQLETATREYELVARLWHKADPELRVLLNNALERSRVGPAVAQ